MTKCFFGVDDEGNLPQMAMTAENDGSFVNRVGLSRKHIFDAVDASVERLGTYIDVLMIHRLDRETPYEETMRALNDVVESGKVRYIGASSVRNPSPLCLDELIRYLIATPVLICSDGRLGIPNAAKHRRPQRLAPVHCHAKLS